MAPKQETDADGWGADAPPVTRTQIEKVESAYKPTKVNMAELTSKKPDTSRFQAPQAQETPSDVVKGGYQPIGKVDIAAIRAQAKAGGQTQDDRPTVVKGAYEPVGKVDIAAIRAKAQAAPSPSGLSPAATGTSNRSNDDESPRSLAERSAAFNQPERLTALPKPKVANKFGGAGAFSGTKAPTPSEFGIKPVSAAAQVGSASKTFADQGGKTPAQIWAEKKAAQGQSVKSPSAIGSVTSPVQAQKSGEGGWKSGYTGKTWAPVQTTRTGQSAASNLSDQRTGGEPQQDEPSSPAGGVSALKDRFKGAAPMGAPTTRAVPEPVAPSPPPMDMSSKPNAGARGVPIPGLPTRPSEDEIPAVQHQRLPSPPPQPRSPSPEPSGSPVRIAMPVGRGRQPEDLSPPEEKAPPMPTRSLDHAAQQARDVPPEPKVEAKDPARGAGVAVAAATFGAAAVAGVAAGAAISATSGGGNSGGGKRAVVQYDYEKAEDNEIELREGEYVTNIDMVDEDWWMGTNAQGEQGLFPSNYVELVEDEEEAVGGGAPPPLPTHPAAAEEEPPAASPHPAGGAGPTATALYDYDAAEDNELSFPEGATITQVVSSQPSPRILNFTNLAPRNSLTKTGGLAHITAPPACSQQTTCSWTSSRRIVVV